MHIKKLLERQQDNNNTAVIINNHSYSYKDLYDRAKTLSSFLSRIISPSSGNIALFLPNSYQYVYSYFAITMADKVIVPISNEAKAPEIVATVDYCDVDIIITDSKHIPIIIEVISKVSRPILIINGETQEIIEPNDDYNSLHITREPNWNEDLFDVAIMLHTSGTTSNPKRVMLTHENLIANIKSNICSLELTSADKVLIQLPMFFGYCNTAQLLTHIYLGASIVIMDKIFTPNYFWRMVERERITNFTTVPSCLLLLLESRSVAENQYASLRYICFGGGIMPFDQLKILIERYPSIGFVHTYGQTEASPRITCLLPPESLVKLGSVGKPIPNVELSLINITHTEDSKEGIGELIVRGPNVMKGYYKRKEETSRTVVNGWLHTGDLGKYDDEGFIYLVGRKKNIIISSGINIYPEEIEEIIMNFSNTEKVIVFGEADDLFGELPVAKIKFKNQENEQENISLLKEHCQKLLSTVKVPKKFYVVSEFEQTLTGKLKRF
ncbi:class I adenylate-forming enzyme family protein [Paenibacillus camerounensis]|uniref:class I adenylate-forming enzyme family protein n=1 Tax=Paenibacillus camerounensis TaxID=1243663 RepID=UPI0005AA3E7E|nr:class I adenylate-forming enzyme family protein [Paenibacillus camerounensis]